MAAAAGIGVAGSLLGGLVGGKGQKKAAQAQLQAQREALAQQQRQFDVTQANTQPFIAAGQGALGAQQNLVGLGGNDAQMAAIQQLQNSPGFTSLFDQGKDTILQSAAATGGLRGGNTQNSLAQFGSGLLGQVIQQQLGNLGGLSSLGANAASGLGQISQSNSNSQSQIYGNMGDANALKAGSMYTSLAGALQGIGQHSGGLASLFGGGGGGGFNQALSNSMTNATLANVSHPF